MTKRRSRGDGGLHWDHKRQRWIATASLGFEPSGKRIVKRASGKTKTAAKEKLKEVLRDYEDGLAIAPTGYTVKDAVTDWLAYGLAGRDPRRSRRTPSCATTTSSLLWERGSSATSAQTTWTSGSPTRHRR